MILRPMALLLATTTTLTAAPAAGQQNTAVDLGTLVLSPSLSPVEGARTGSTVEVIEGRDAGSDDSRVVDRLTRLPGVNSTSNGGLGALATVQLRGLPSRYIKVEVDGIDVLDPSGTQNQFNFGGLSGANIGRIEILKGTQSALYGSEAIGGVINITSWRPEELGFSGEAALEGGSFGTYSGRLSLGVRGERGFAALSVNQIDSDGISAQSFNTEEDGFKQTTLNFSAEHDVTDTVTVGGAIYYRDGDVEIDRSSFTGDATGEIFSEELGAKLYVDFETGAISHRLSLSYFDIDRRDPGGFTTRFQGERTTVEYLGSAVLSDTMTLNFGIEHSKEDIDSGTTVGSEDNSSAMVELLYSPTSQLDLSLALRYDDNSDFGGQATGRIAAAWRPSEDWILRASAATGYRAPSLYERFSSFGDPTLQPENSRSFELGVERRLGDRGFVKATVFHTEIDDLIDFDATSTACAGGGGCYNQVSGTTKSRGVELSGEYALTDMLTVYGAYTYTDADTDGVRLTRTPRHDVALGLSADFTDRFAGYLDMRHVADVVPSAFAPAGHKVGDYTLVGLGLSYDVTDTAQVYLRVENLFDEDYETAGGYNQPGRAAFVGLRARF